MPPWMIRLFGDAALTQLFWAITLAPLPLWLLMIALPHHRLTRLLASPFTYPLILLPGLAYLYALIYRLVAPFTLVKGNYREVEAILTHPAILLTIWAQLLLLNLIVGIIIYRDAQPRKIGTRLILTLAILSGPAALAAYQLRLLIHRLHGKKVKGGLAR